ncbi:RNA methyltransferase [Nitriliruptoraceae bacterium ZYF776]|nr:RNA methyltransferase [Profundirhabdus halotolerans]
MADLLHIDDPADERLGDYAALNDPALRKRYENRLGVFIAEGPNPVRELVASRYPVRSLLLAEERLVEVGDLLDAVDAPAYVVPRDVLYALVRFPLHQGVLACGRRLGPPSVEEVVDGARRLLVLEGLNDHENLGTLFRSARGLGADGVLLGAGCADPLYRRSVRVSMGHVLHLPFTPAGPVADLLPRLHAAGVATVALTPDPDATELGAFAPGEGPVALLLGAEGPGLSDAALAGVHHRLRIAMDAGVDSLNVAAAGAVALHALRRRP